jgi:putative hydrolase of the HAD superfamily
MAETKIKSVIFDIGGVIIKGCWGKQFLDKSADKLGVDSKKLRELIDVHEPALMRGELNDTEFWRNIIQEAEDRGVPLENKEISDEELKKLWLEDFEKSFEPRKEMLDLLTELRDKGFGVGCISNSIPPHTEHNIEVGLYDKPETKPENIEGYFHPIYISDMVGKTKFETGEEKEKIFKDYLKEAGCEPGEAIFIDDEERNLEIPREIGIGAVRFENTDEYKKDLEKFFTELEEKLGIELEVNKEVKKELQNETQGEIGKEFKLK